MGQSVADQMTDQRRALLTEREREILTGEADVTDNYRYSVESRVRSRLRDRLQQDVDVIRDFYPEMFDEVLYPVVCQPASDDIADSGVSGGGDSNDSEPAESAEEPSGSEPTTPSHTRDAGEGAASADDLDQYREQLQSELAGSGELLEARVDEILAMYQYLREHGEAEKRDLLEAVDIDATGYESADSVWANMVKGKDTLRALPGVETPAPGRSTWSYTGE